MFKTKKNFRRNAKHKQQKNTKKTTQYEEDYNEVILNDLVDDNKENKDVKVQEKPTRKTKKGFNLGAKKKSTSNENINKKHKNNKSDPKEIIDVDSKKDLLESESHPNTKKVHKKEKKLSKKKSPKKQAEPNKSDKVKKAPKKSKREDIKTQSVEEVEVDKINEDNEDNDEQITESSVFRSAEDIKENPTSESKEKSQSESKPEDIIWSDDKFPKN
ncbi:hypothetical protein [Terrisporobacter sp.]